MEIHESAYRHGVGGDDIEHCIAHCIVSYPLDPDEPTERSLCLGPDRAGNMLEIIIVPVRWGDGLVIHAMKMRAQYRDLLKGWTHE